MPTWSIGALMIRFRRNDESGCHERDAASAADMKSTGVPRSRLGGSLSPDIKFVTVNGDRKFVHFVLAPDMGCPENRDIKFVRSLAPCRFEAQRSDCVRAEFVRRDGAKLLAARIAHDPFRAIGIELNIHSCAVVHPANVQFAAVVPDLSRTVDIARYGVSGEMSEHEIGVPVTLLPSRAVVAARVFQFGVRDHARNASDRGIPFALHAIFSIDPRLELTHRSASRGFGPRFRQTLAAFDDTILLRAVGAIPVHRHAQADHPQSQHRRQVAPRSPRRPVVDAQRSGHAPLGKSRPQMPLDDLRRDAREIAFGKKRSFSTRRRCTRRRAAARRSFYRCPAVSVPRRRLATHRAARWPAHRVVDAGAPTAPVACSRRAAIARPCVRRATPRRSTSRPAPRATFQHPTWDVAHEVSTSGDAACCSAWIDARRPPRSLRETLRRHDVVRHGSNDEPCAATPESRSQSATDSRRPQNDSKSPDAPATEVHAA